MDSTYPNLGTLVELIRSHSYKTPEDSLDLIKGTLNTNPKFLFSLVIELQSLCNHDISVRMEGRVCYRCSFVEYISFGKFLQERR